MTPNATVVTAAAIQREAGGMTYALIVNEQSTVERRNLEIGAQSGNVYLVKSGLQAGDKVIISNIQKIREGVPVTAIESSQEQKQPQQDNK